VVAAEGVGAGRETGGSMNAVSRTLRLGAGAVARSMAALGVPLWLAACTPPGWADPTEWFGGSAAPAERIDAADASEPGPYPLIGKVPEAAPRPSPQYRRDQRVQELLTARADVRYTEGPATAEAPATHPASGPGAAAPRPAAAPRAAVVPSKPFPPGPAPAPPPRPAAPAGPAATALLAPDAPPGPEPLAAPDPATEESPPRPPEQAVEPGGWAARGRLVGVIQFLDGSISVDARDRSILRDIARLQQQRGGRIRVVGHASGRAKSLDPAAHRLANFELSLGRARNVALAMMEFGVDPGILQVVAASAHEPAYEETQPTGEAGNRRVEIFLEN